MEDNVGLGESTSGNIEGIKDADAWGGGDDYRGEGVRPRRFTFKASGAIEAERNPTPIRPRRSGGNVVKEKAKRIGLTEDRAKFILDNCKSMNNREIGEAIGCSESAIHRYKINLVHQKRMRSSGVDDKTLEEWGASWEAHLERQRVMGVSPADILPWGELDSGYDTMPK